MKFIKCLSCKSKFIPRPQCPNQTYCSKEACQKVRKNKWANNKLKTDSSYKENQAAANRAWRLKNPDYYKQYRSSKKAKEKAILLVAAKIDVSIDETNEKSNRYELIVLDDTNANIGVYLVKIIFISNN